MILVDVTTSYNFRHWKAMGLLRVEQEVIRAFRTAYGDAVTFGIYNPVLGGYFRVPGAEIDALLAEGRWSVPPLVRATTAPSRRERHLRRLRLFRELRRAMRGHAGDDPATEWRRDTAIAEALTRVSLDEYASLSRWLQPVERRVKALGAVRSRADLVNHRLHFGQLDAQAPARFAPENAVDPGEVTQYLSVGGFWGDDRYEYAYHARKAHGWTVHYLIYDLIPVLWRHLTEPTTKETFPLALHWVLWGVDQVWTISDTTRQDLLAHIDDHGYPPMPERWVTPVLLGADSASGEVTPEATRATLARHDLDAGGFVLMVGTLEPRKNHDFAYRLWRELHKRHPGEVLPLVFVGQPGWNMEGFAEMLAEDVGLPHRAIRILTDVDDAALGVLYETCRFTLYPSHYEGWGLPVVESLNHGKPCLTSDAPSIVEAAQGAADTLPLMDGEAWMARAFALMNDADAYAGALARARAFGGYSWEEFRTNLLADFEAFLQDGAAESRAG
ncbi:MULTISPECIES: glycosyltransferase family 1 protein [unclassified Mameliella]|uniref:glycosyltransferase family 4 protein n=1 Tax=unclassified Mameliella TaxID=2630630 RepID=UPI00273F6ADD|nr:MULTISPECIES: glycosyltransferase family 1 protein [unclassified Mameliella]